MRERIKLQSGEPQSMVIDGSIIGPGWNRQSAFDICARESVRSIGRPLDVGRAA